MLCLRSARSAAIAARRAIHDDWNRAVLLAGSARHTR